MTYNAKKPNEIEPTTGLPADSILDGVIINIKDGYVKDFVANTEKWKNADSNAIEITSEVAVKKENSDVTEMVQLTQIYTYISENDKTTFTKGSNLSKYFNKYKKLPEAGDQVKIVTNEKGFGKIKID